MKVNDKKIYILIIILLISYIVLFFKYDTKNNVYCSKVTKEENFTKNNYVTIKHKEDKIKSVKMKETFTSPKESIISLKKEEYKNKKYTFKEKNNTLTAFYDIKTVNSYKDAITMLYESGYTCK